MVWWDFKFKLELSLSMFQPRDFPGVTCQLLERKGFIVSECLLWRYGSAVACHRGRGSGCRRPAHTACGMSLSEDVATNPTLELPTRLTAEQLYQRNSHTVKKVLGPTTDFPAWGSGKGTENPQGI